MASKLIYTCDRCQKNPPSRLDSGGFPPLWNVQIKLIPVDAPQSNYHPVEQSAEWCNDCVEEMQIRRPLLRVDMQTPGMTLEEQIREIVRTTIQEE